MVDRSRSVYSHDHIACCCVLGVADRELQDINSRGRKTGGRDQLIGRREGDGSRPADNAPLEYKRHEVGQGVVVNRAAEGGRVWKRDRLVRPGVAGRGLIGSGGGDVHGSVGCKLRVGSGKLDDIRARLAERSRGDRLQGIGEQDRPRGALNDPLGSNRASGGQAVVGYQGPQVSGGIANRSQADLIEEGVVRSPG